MKFNPQNEEYVYVQLYNTTCPHILTELFQSWHKTTTNTLTIRFGLCH